MADEDNIRKETICSALSERLQTNMGGFLDFWKMSYYLPEEHYDKYHGVFHKIAANERDIAQRITKIHKNMTCPLTDVTKAWDKLDEKAKKMSEKELEEHIQSFKAGKSII